MGALGFLLLSGCGLRDYIPRGPVADSDTLGQGAPVVWTGPATMAAPALAIPLFGVHYDEDIVIQSDHPHWTMHEYARIVVDDQTLWMAKDSDPEGVQTIVAALPELESYVPEVPVPRISGPLRVEDRSTDDWLDVELAYTNPLGEWVEVSFRAPRGGELERKRNSSTFNHSSQAISAVLDVPRKQMAGVEASIGFDGVPARIDRVAGVKVQVLLEQSQGGFALPNHRSTRTPEGLRVERPALAPWPTRSDEQWSVEGETATRGTATLETATHRFAYRYQDGGLVEAEVFQQGRPVPVTRLVLDGPLPDGTRPFSGTVSRAFRLDINGQIGHGVGVIHSTATSGGARLCVAPEAPAWLRDRPMQIEVTVTGEQAQVLGQMGCETPPE